MRRCWRRDVVQGRSNGSRVRGLRIRKSAEGVGERKWTALSHGSIVNGGILEFFVSVTVTFLVAWSLIGFETESGKDLFGMLLVTLVVGFVWVFRSWPMCATCPCQEW